MNEEDEKIVALKCALRSIILSYEGTDFREFCSYINEEMDKLMTEECPERLRWKAYAFGLICVHSQVKGIEIPEKCFTIPGEIFGLDFGS